MSENSVPDLWPSFASFTDGRTINEDSLVAERNAVHVEAGDDGLLTPGDVLRFEISAWDPLGRRLRIDAEIRGHEKLGSADVGSGEKTQFTWHVQDKHIQGYVNPSFTLTARGAENHRTGPGFDQKLGTTYHVRPGQD